MSNYFTDLELDVIDQMVGKLLVTMFKSAEDPMSAFIHSIYRDSGSRTTKTDHITVYLDRSTGQMYNTAASTALEAGKGFENREDILTKTVSLDPYSAHWIISRHDRAILRTIMNMTDPVARMEAFTRTFEQNIYRELYSAVVRRREALVSSFMDGLESYQAFGENILKSSVTGTEVYSFVNLLSAASGNDAIKAVVNAFNVQRDADGNRISGMDTKWLFVNQDVASWEEVMNVDKYVNVNYRNLTARIKEAKFVVQYDAETPDDSSIHLAKQHTIVMHGREEIAQIEVKDDIEGTKIVIDDFAVVEATCGIGLAKNTPAT